VSGPAVSGPAAGDRAERRPLVIGVGNRFRRDDGVGPAVLDLLREHGADADLRLVESSGEGATLIDLWRGEGQVMVIDAVRSNSAPGTVHVLDTATRTIPQDFFHYSSHAFAVAEAVEMSRALGQLPPELMLYGIEGGDFGAGQGLTFEVARAAEQVAGWLLAAAQ
jgi:hydrogenase maturation protease